MKAIDASALFRGHCQGEGLATRRFCLSKSLLVSGFAAFVLAAQLAAQAATTLVAIDDNTMWRYDRSGQDLGTAWKEKGFNDSAWPQGAALLGEESTTVDTMRTPFSRYTDDGTYITTFYFRTHFNYTGAAGAKLRLTHVVDDGAVFYLNGVEVHRFGLAAGAKFDATTYFNGHENAVEGPFDIPASSLVSGDNVLAAEVHQSDTGSSDIVFGASLEVDNTNPDRTTVDFINPKPDQIDVARDVTITIALSDGSQKVQSSSIQLSVNGQSVTPTVTKPAGSFATTVSYKPAASFAAGTLVSVHLVYSDDGTPAVVTTKDYSFTTQVDTKVIFGVDDTTMWRYDRSGTDLGTAWKEKSFNDSSWPEGAALIGEEGSTVETMRTPISRYNDNGDYITTMYFRTHFNYTGNLAATVLRLRHVIDDGAVFYLNGVEVYRFGLGAGATFNYATYFDDHENAWEGPVNIPTASLVAGDNVFAVEVHQSGGSSSDIVFGAELSAGVLASKPPVVESVNPLPDTMDAPADTTIQFTLTDGTSKVAPASIQLTVNGQSVTPAVDKPAGGSTTKVTYKPASSFAAGSVVSVKLVFSDDAAPANVISKEFSFTVRPNTLVAIDDKTMWRYDRSGTDLGTAWKEKGFNDSAWPQGAALLGQESTTVVPMRTPFSRLDDAGVGIITFYFRTHFTFSGDPASAQLQLRHVVDDGAVFYLNGAEIYRMTNMPSGPITYTTLANPDHENDWEGPFAISTASLVAGDNVLAVEVHQNSATSSDIVFGAELALAPATVPTGATMSIARSGADVVVSWTGSGTLQSADTVIGPWSDVSGAASPKTIAAPAGTKFYRVKQ